MTAACFNRCDMDVARKDLQRGRTLEPSKHAPALRIGALRQGRQGREGPRVPASGMA